MSAAPTVAHRRPTALYDGHCLVCKTIRRTLRLMGGTDDKIEWLSLHDPSVPVRYSQFTHDALMKEIYVDTPEFGVLRGFQAARYLLGVTPLGRPLWAIFYLPGMGWLGDKAYRFISANRYRVNKFFGVELEYDPHAR